ncbi:hypothetical protein DEU56DRAFT_754864 [Suillus clintonianus]|uniref:uncharacterized protein n=1 Tax=Suillus clintonianus TaxID=1904413 RepID=UPI001B87EDFF|nr:uncharacterized protein DEU56DRAFT_754864 [Suillus clintonianus]KAG2141901.1 hypothetical protein DEU56DRAFT_754864 [Suillus clintonianus]
MTALQKILGSQATMLDLETTYSRAAIPNPNHCAIELKDRSFNAIITERQQQLDTVLHEISDLQTVMDSIQNLHQQLVEKKVKIVESINLHKRLRSALWRLPTEVLSHIFVYCLPGDKYLLPTPGVAPMLLTRICRRWKEVAVAMPSLWCRLQLKTEYDDWKWQGAFCYDSWLKRTLGCPLSLELQCNGHWTQVQNLLQPYFTQISSLSIDFWASDTPELMVLTGCQALEELSVTFSDDMAGDDMLARVGRAISQLPSTLCNLSVAGWALSLGDVSTFDPVWAHLTTVEILVQESGTALHLLQLAPNLSSLTIHAISHGIQTAFESFTHTKLKSFEIICENSSRRGPKLSALLDALSLPALRVLYLHNIGAWPHMEFKAFLARSKCPLKSLGFGGRMTPGDKQRAEYDEYLATVSDSERKRQWASRIKRECREYPEYYIYTIDFDSKQLTSDLERTALSLYQHIQRRRHDLKCHDIFSSNATQFPRHERAPMIKMLHSPVKGMENIVIRYRATPRGGPSEVPGGGGLLLAQREVEMEQGNAVDETTLEIVPSARH